MPEGTVTIRKGREKPIKNQHPWIFSGSITNADNATPGDLVRVVNHRGEFLAIGYWNPNSTIQVRIMTWQDEPVNADWWRDKLRRAIRHRYPDKPQFNVGNRIVNAENDFLPGLIVDRYGDWLVLQALTMHIDRHKEAIAGYLMELFDEAQMPIKGVYERSDVDVREREDLEETKGLLLGDEPPDIIQFGIEKLNYLVDVRHGHKTGFYLDQVQNHDILIRLTFEKNLFTPETRQLNAFSYTGGFGLASAAHVVNVDTSQDALDIAEEAYAQNNHPDADFVQADVFDYLRDVDEQFDIIVLDPPKFAHHKSQIQSAARGYKDINLNAFKRIKPGGYLMTFSCSGAISRDLFQKIVFGALADSGRQAQIVRHLGAAADHPIALTFPEGEYLKGLLLRVL
jgi:23S rRNA (cytosine1962-C5)-methyltransferase